MLPPEDGNGTIVSDPQHRLNGDRRSAIVHLNGQSTRGTGTQFAAAATTSGSVPQHQKVLIVADTNDIRRCLKSTSEPIANEMTKTVGFPKGTAGAPAPNVSISQKQDWPLGRVVQSSQQLQRTANCLCQGLSPKATACALDTSLSSERKYSSSLSLHWTSVFSFSISTTNCPSPAKAHWVPSETGTSPITSKLPRPNPQPGEETTRSQDKRTTYLTHARGGGGLAQGLGI